MTRRDMFARLFEPPFGWADEAALDRDWKAFEAVGRHTAERAIRDYHVTHDKDGNHVCWPVHPCPTCRD